jgi:hypothetical protein
MRVGNGWIVALALALALGLVAGGVPAAEKAEVVDAPPPPEVLRSGEPLEPDVTIRETGSEKIYEYRINGRLVMVRVKPNVGPPYYFVDQNGDGELDYTTSDPRNGPSVNQWILFRWD